MDAAGGAVSRMEERAAGSRLRLRRALRADPVESVIDTFLGGGERSAGAPAPEGVPACPDGACGACVPTIAMEFKPLRLRCPRAAAVVIGVEPSGRVCLEVHVGGGASVASVLGELEEAERWLRSSAHDAATTPVAGRVDMSQPVRRRVRVDVGVELGVGMLARAGVEVRGGAGNRH